MNRRVIAHASRVPRRPRFLPSRTTTIGRGLLRVRNRGRDGRGRSGGRRRRSARSTSARRGRRRLEGAKPGHYVRYFLGAEFVLERRHWRFALKRVFPKVRLLEREQLLLLVYHLHAEGVLVEKPANG